MAKVAVIFVLTDFKYRPKGSKLNLYCRKSHRSNYNESGFLLFKYKNLKVGLKFNFLRYVFLQKSSLWTRDKVPLQRSFSFNSWSFGNNRCLSNSNFELWGNSAFSVWNNMLIIFWIIIPTFMEVYKQLKSAFSNRSNHTKLCKKEGDLKVRVRFRSLARREGAAAQVGNDFDPQNQLKGNLRQYSKL